MSNIGLVNSEYDINGLAIIADGEDSYINLKNADGTTTMITERTKSSDRPLHCSELENKLKYRGWHKAFGKFVTPPKNSANSSNDMILNFLSYNEVSPYSEIDRINRNSPEYKEGEPLPSGARYSINQTTTEDYSSYDTTRIDEFYSKIFKSMKIEKEVEFYSLSKKVVNIIDDIISIDLIQYMSDIYTDTIDLNKLLKYPAISKTSGKVNMTIQYTKDNNIYSSDITFIAFEYNELPDSTVNLEKDNLIQKINEDIQLEYINGIVKIYPLNSDISECIISNCYVTYGKN